MATQYFSELELLPTTYKNAIEIDINSLYSAIASASTESIIAVGSGGSFTVATLLCNLHETYTGRVSRPSTPLEIIANPTLASTSPVFFISAEGKNPDIVEALYRAKSYSSREIHVIVNRNNCPLIECAKGLEGVRIHSFPLEHKDGFLATNSLIYNSILIARAYSEHGIITKMPQSMTDLTLNNVTIIDWLLEAREFANYCAKCGNVIIIYSPLLKPIAVDLESKLSESALLYCQLTDLRSFAHGRHLWLSKRPSECACLAIIDLNMKPLWENTKQLFPDKIQTFSILLPDASPVSLVAGLISQMKFVSLIADINEMDLGKPEVPNFGRDIHYLDINKFIPAYGELTDGGAHAKYEVLECRWPTLLRQDLISDSLQEYKNAFKQQLFSAIVFDYDGTLCSSCNRDQPPPSKILYKIVQLLKSNIIIGIATGRGKSIIECLRPLIPEEYHDNIIVGLYNCGLISKLSNVQDINSDTNEFLNHVTRIVGRLTSLLGHNWEIRLTQPFQVSIRFPEGAHGKNNWFIIADALRQSGLDTARIVYSKHSVDVLAKGVDKSHLIAKIIEENPIEPYQILTMGDQGAWPGNDWSLLEHRFSLSVDVPSRRIDRGWNLAPINCKGVDATLWYLDRIEEKHIGKFKVCF